MGHNHAPFQGWFAIHGLALATVNLPTKFEVSISTHYEDMKDDTICPNTVVWGSWCYLRSLFDRAHTSSY